MATLPHCFTQVFQCLIVVTCLYPNAGKAQLQFTEISQEAGLNNGLRSEALAVGDYNNDGFPDVYVSYTFGPNQLLHNNGDGTFTDRAPLLGLVSLPEDRTTTASWADYDNDGDLDLYVGAQNHPDQLYRNDGDGSFTEVTTTAGLGQVGYPKSLNWADFNRDGHLDLYVSNLAEENVFYLNNGDGTFTDHTQLSQALDDGFSMGTIAFDYDRDGDQDLLLIKDNLEASYLYENNGSAIFTEVAAERGLATQSFGMGVDVADINQDGWPDIYITNLYNNYLLVANGDGTYTNTSIPAGVADPGMGWGVTFLDAENNGLPDIYVANEYSFSPFKNLLYHNDGDGTFTKSLDSEPICNTLSSWGTSTLDLDMDGRMDLLVANHAEGENTQLFRNESTVGNWLKLKLHGVQSNRQAIGAVVELVDDQGKVHYQEIIAGSSWECQKSSIMHFGLGVATSFTSATINWPSGLQQSLTELVVNHIFTVVEGNPAEEGLDFKVATSIEEAMPEKLAVLTVTPNPITGDYITVEWTGPSLTVSNLDIRNINGKLVYRRQLSASENANGNCRLSRNIPALNPPGMYFLSLHASSGTISRKILLQ